MRETRTHKTGKHTYDTVRTRSGDAAEVGSNKTPGVTELSFPERRGLVGKGSRARSESSEVSPGKWGGKGTLRRGRVPGKKPMGTKVTQAHGEVSNMAAGEDESHGTQGLTVTHKKGVTF